MKSDANQDGVGHMCSKFGLIELRNFIWLRGVNGMVNLRVNVKEEVWKKCICERIWEVGRVAWKDGVKNTEREREYVRMKECPRRESFQMAVLVLK